MEFIAHDGATLSLKVLGYQFASNDRCDVGDDWLVVEGRVGLAEGRHWTFVHPCLNVSEARTLGEWLRAPVGPCAFVEPLVALRVDGDRLEVQFSHEAIPPWMQSQHQRDWLGLTFVLSLSLGADLGRCLEEAADVWERGIRSFPGRVGAPKTPGEAEALLHSAVAALKLV